MSKQNTHVNVRVKEKKGEPFERMVKRFLKKVKKERIVEQVKERRYYEKPSVVKRREKLAGIARWKKHLAEKKQKELQKEANYNKRFDNKRKED
jgi:small subunit ribosomal protein S21